MWYATIDNWSPNSLRRNSIADKHVVDIRLITVAIRIQIANVIEGDRVVGDDESVHVNLIDNYHVRVTEYDEICVRGDAECGGTVSWWIADVIQVLKVVNLLNMATVIPDQFESW